LLKIVDSMRMTQTYKIKRGMLTSMASKLQTLGTTIIINLITIKIVLWAETYLIMVFQFIFNQNMDLTSEAQKLTFSIIETMKTNKECEISGD
jgi:hypothetical protein